MVWIGRTMLPCNSTLLMKKGQRCIWIPSNCQFKTGGKFPCSLALFQLSGYITFSLFSWYVAGDVERSLGPLETPLCIHLCAFTPSGSQRLAKHSRGFPIPFSQGTACSGNHKLHTRAFGSLIPRLSLFFVRARGEPGNEAMLLNHCHAKCSTIIFSVLNAIGVCTATLLATNYEGTQTWKCKAIQMWYRWFPNVS